MRQIFCLNCPLATIIVLVAAEEQINMERQSSASFLKNRHLVPVVTAGRDQKTLSLMRQALKAIGYSKIRSVESREKALVELDRKETDLVIFEATTDTKGDMLPIDFVREASQLRASVILMAITNSPEIDKVLGIIQAGARGFVVVPFTTQSVEEALQRAASMKPSSSIQAGSDTNRSLAISVLNNLDRLAKLKLCSKKNLVNKKTIEKYRYQLFEAIDMASMFSDSSDRDCITNAIVEECVSRAKAKAQRASPERAKQKVGST